MTRLIISLILILTLPVPAYAFDSAEKKEIEAIIKQYLLDNPGIIFEAADKHQANLAKEAEEKSNQTLKDKAAQLFKNDKHFFLGDKSARVPIVEFFDYNCGYCKQVFKSLQDAVAKNKDLRIVLIDTPILGPSSTLAARWAIAAGTFGKYIEFHTALMNFQGPKDDATLSQLATDVGLDPAKMRAAAEEEAVTKQIDENMALFQALGLNGTPAFAAPDRILRGAATPEVLDQVVKDYLAKNPTLPK
jgi:protein-disulfide isomerase